MHSSNSKNSLIVLVVGANGSIGRLVVEEAHRRGHHVRALVRDPQRAARFPDGVEIVRGDVTRRESLAAAVRGIDAVAFTLGSEGQGRSGPREVDYGGVRNVLMELGSRDVRIALMTAIGVTNRTGQFNQGAQSHDWKRRAERLVRASGHRYTIVRPGWFDYNKLIENELVFRQGDTRHAGNPSDGVISRRAIARVMVESLVLDVAAGKTFELVCKTGDAQADLAPLFAALAPDVPGSPDAPLDAANQPLADEPASVLDELQAIASRQLPA